MLQKNTIDICKGLPILLMYLGHYVLYHSINMSEVYGWCGLLNGSISSYHMAVYL